MKYFYTKLGLTFAIDIREFLQDRFSNAVNAKFTLSSRKMKLRMRGER